MSTEEKVLEAMANAGQPVGTSKIVELTGLDKKEVEKAMKTLKESGQIVSPKRCVWEVKN
jgi:predicted transcriptional regulator